MMYMCVSVMACVWWGVSVSRVSFGWVAVGMLRVQTLSDFTPRRSCVCVPVSRCPRSMYALYSQASSLCIF